MNKIRIGFCSDIISRAVTRGGGQGRFWGKKVFPIFKSYVCTSFFERITILIELSVHIYKKLYLWFWGKKVFPIFKSYVCTSFFERITTLIELSVHIYKNYAYIVSILHSNVPFSLIKIVILILIDINITSIVISLCS